MEYLLFSLYSLLPAPIFFNPQVVAKVEQRAPAEHRTLAQKWNAATIELEQSSNNVLERATPQTEQAYHDAQLKMSTLRKQYKTLATKHVSSDSNDTNYIFLHFVRTVLPIGLVGLLFAVVILASWGSISAALHSLASSSVVDVHTLLRKTPTSDDQQVHFAKTHTLFWGIFCIGVAMFAAQMDSLIEAVNVLGSLFYGTILRRISI